MAKIFSQESKFMAFLAGIFDFMLLGFLWLIFSVPVITIGASTTAAYYTVVKGIRRGRGYIWGNFWKSFRMNFLPATGFWLVSLAVDALFAFNIAYTYNQLVGQLGYMAYAMIIIYIIILVVAVFTELYLFPVLSRFNMKPWQMIKTSFFFGLKHLPVTLLLLVILAANLFSIWFLVQVYPLAMLFVGAVFSWLYSLPMESVLKKYVPAYDEEDHTRDQWYAE